MMMVSDEEKRWIVVGIAMNKVAAPVLRDAVKQGMDTNYANLDRHCHLLHPPCTLKTLTHGVVRADPILKNLKFQNINNNHLVRGVYNYNFNINSSLDLAKLYLPGYLAQFSGFDDSLDMTAILRLLGFRNYMPAVVFSPHTQTSADDVRENVRNKWGHVDVTVWTDALFNDCFDKLKTLVRSLGLTAVVEKNTLDQLADWQTKGCHLVMGHAVDKELQQEVRVLIKNIRSRMRLKNKKICEIEEDVAILKDESSCKRARLDAHDEHLYSVEEKVQEVLESIGEMEKVLERLVSFEAELSKRLLAVEEGLAKTDGRVEKMEQSQAKTDDRVEELKQIQTEVVGEVDLLKQRHTETLGKVDQLEQSQTSEVERLKQSNVKTVGEVEMLKQNHSEAVAKVGQLEQRCAKTDGKVEQMQLDVKNWMTQTDKPEASCMKLFDLNSCRSKLEDHYQQTATVPTSVWSKKSVVDIHQIYTRLSWVKEEQTPAGTTQSELKHYTDLFTANKSGVIPKRILVQGQTGTNRNKHQEQRQEQTPAETTQSELKHYTDLFTANKNGVTPKRILVQGQTGIGKSTFVKKLLVDWVGVNKGTGDEQAAVLKNFELVVAVNLKEVSKCQSLRDVITLSNVFAKEDKYMTEGLVDYISNNQEKVLLIFDGYDEYRCGRDSEIYEIFSGNSLRSCCVLITTRISKADELRGGEDLHAEIIGFSAVDRECFMRRFLNSEEVSKLKYHLYERQLEELAKVPLLLLFFCLQWRKGQSESFPKSKTTLYMDIIQFILNHSHSKQTDDKTKKAPQYVELKSFKEILSEIGKVALQGLLKDDHLFEYSQLSDSVRCDESVFIGLLQITEYSETLRPVGLVSFIHKSIQEFLAAWYVTYRCIPEGGNLGEIGVKLEECLALENVFQFICGLSKDGASTVFRHLKSVRISDPSLDLSKAVPDVENETDEPLSGVTERQEKFRDLVLFSFEGIESEAELSSSCLDSLGNFLLVSGYSFPNYLLEKAIDTNSWSLVLNRGDQSLDKRALARAFVSGENLIPTRNKMVEILFTKGSKFLKVAQLLEKFNNFCGFRGCDFSPILCFRNGQVFFYITQLELRCEKHARLFTDSVVPLQAVHSTSGQLCVKFLKTLKCYGTRFSMESLGAVIKHCNHLERIVCDFADFLDLFSYDPYDVKFDSDDCDAHDSVCHLLEQVPNPGMCSLSIEFCALTSTGAVKLASLLPRFENVILLKLSLVKCSTDAVTRLVAAIKHKTLKKLSLIIGEINLTSAVVEALCQSLPELLALETLAIVTLDGYRLRLVVNRLVDLHNTPRLTIVGLTDSSAEAITRLIDVFDHNIFRELELEKIHLTPVVAVVLVQLLSKLSALRTLAISSLTECSDEAVTRLIDGINHKTLEELELSEMNLTSAVAEALGRSLPELSALQILKISGLGDSRLQHKEVEALFARFNRPSSLKELWFNDFTARGSLAPLVKNLCLFPCLKALRLENLAMGEADLSDMLENLKFTPDLHWLFLRANRLGHAVRSMIPYLLKQQKLEKVFLGEGDCSEEDFKYVQEAVKEKRPRLNIDASSVKLATSAIAHLPIRLKREAKTYFR